MRTSPHRTVTRSRRLGAVALVVGALLVAACGSDSNSGSPSGTGDTAGSSGSSGSPATTTAGGTDAPRDDGCRQRPDLARDRLRARPADARHHHRQRRGDPRRPALQRLRDAGEDRRGPSEYAPAPRQGVRRSPTTGSPTPSPADQGVTFQNGEPFYVERREVQLRQQHRPTSPRARRRRIISATFAPVAIGRGAGPQHGRGHAQAAQPRLPLQPRPDRRRDRRRDQALPTIATKPIGTGPFQFDSYSTNDSLKLKRYDGYWGTKPSLAEGGVPLHRRPQGAGRLDQSPGGIDIIDNLTPELFKDVPGRSPTSRRSNIVTNGETILAMNNSRTPLDDVRVRQAITLRHRQEGGERHRRVGLRPRSSAPTPRRTTRGSRTCRTPTRSTRTRPRSS